jgi:hypothetical protein
LGRIFFVAICANIGFASDNRFDSRLLRSEIELDRAEQRSMIGERDCRHAQLRGALHHFLNFARPVEQAVLGMIMQMNEIQTYNSPSSLTISAPTRESFSSSFS